MKKGFRILYDTIKNKWEIKYYGDRQQFSYFDFGDGKHSVLKKCTKCHSIHWQDLEGLEHRDLPKIKKLKVHN